VSGSNADTVDSETFLITIFVVSLVGVGTGSVAAQSAPDCSTVTYTGDGSVANPYEVSDLDQLQCVEEQGLNENYVQVSDIDATETEVWNGGKGFDPIGNASNPFLGTFDGNGHLITGLSINRSSEDLVGLFAGVGDSTTIVTEVSVVDADITGDRQVGILAGQNRDTITESYVKGNLNGNNEIGGLVGKNTDRVENSSADVSVDASSAVGGLIGVSENDATVSNSYAVGDISASSDEVGGLIGINRGRIERSHATGDVNGAGNDVGGFAGISSGRIIESYSTGSVDGVRRVGGLAGKQERGISIENSHATGDVSGSYRVGGLLGWNDFGTVSQSYATGNVTGSEDDVGGLVGQNDDRIRGSYAIGSVVGNTVNVGGLVGFNDGEVENSYAMGSVDGVKRVGGLVGKNDDRVSSTYATGPVSGFEDVGGVVGLNGFGVENSYWDKEATGQSSSDGGTGLTTEEMIGDAAPGNMTGLSFPNGWEAVTSPDNYPVLAWQPEDDRRGNFPPTAEFTISPTDPNVSETVSFDASASTDRDGAVGSYSWDFGDGTTSTGKKTAHSYNAATDYTVALTVTDDKGATDTKKKTVSVSGSTPPVATVNSESVIIRRAGETENSEITVDAPRGISTVDVTVSVNTSAGRISDVTEGADVNSELSEVLFNITDQTDGSVTVEYTNIEGTGPAQNFELADVSLELLSNNTDTPISLETDNFVYLSGSETEPYENVNKNEGNLTDAVFLNPLPVSGFDNPPRNIPPDQGGLDSRLIEDLDGDGDPTDVPPTVRVFGELIRSDDLGLSNRQARALNWNADSPETEVTPADMVSLFGEKIRAD